MSTRNEDLERIEKKMNKMLDDTLGRKDGMVKVAHAGSSANSSYKQYKSSFLTMGDMQIPEDYREIFKWCRYFFKFDSLIGGAVRSLATFPVTDYVVNDSSAAEEDESIDDNDTSEEYKFYSGVLKEIELYKHSIEIGLDYWLYGNCIILAEPGTKMVESRDKETGAIVKKKQVVWKNVRRLDPSRIRIDRDPATQEKIFYYEVPADIKAIILSKKPKEKYDRVPAIFKKAVEQKGIIRLNSDYVYHFSMPSESGDSGLWATPPILHAMKLILYTNILRQAQEAIAYEHIIPKRVYYFNETNAVDPSYDFGRVADDFAYELTKQLKDPNYQIVSPVPINQIQHGGAGKALMLVPEIEQLQNTILAAMNVPREFIFGGVSYSGSTTSLRILENNFITYRVLLEDYINNFLIKGLAKLRGEWEVPEDDEKMITVTFAELKMQDDIQQKELMIRLNQQEKLPDDVLYEKVLGMDGPKIVRQLHTEKKRKMEENFELQIMQMEMQAKMEAQANLAPGTLNAQQAGAEGAEPGAEGAGTGQPGAEATAQPGAQPEGQPEGQQQGSVNQQAMQMAQALTQVPEEEAEMQLAKLPKQAQTIVRSYYVTLMDQKGMEADMRPAPEKLPPRREGGV